MTRVKICGVTSETDRDVAVAAGADAVGVLVDVPVDTPREIDPAHARSILAALPPFTTGVLVTLADAVQPVVTLQEEVAADVVQVHGGLTPSQFGALRERVDTTVVAAVDAAAADIAAYAEASDALLVDSAGEAGRGGTGETHDWDRTRAYVADLDVPVILAGGLTPANVAEAIRTVEPYAVDTASGVESSGGVKDPDAVERFVDAARGMEGSA